MLTTEQMKNGLRGLTLGSVVTPPPLPKLAPWSALIRPTEHGWKVILKRDGSFLVRDVGRTWTEGGARRMARRALARVRRRDARMAGKTSSVIR